MSQVHADDPEARVQADIRDEEPSGAPDRDNHPVIGKLIYWFAAAVAMLHVYMNTLGTVDDLWASGIHFASFGALAAMTLPAVRTEVARWRSWVLSLDILLALATLSTLFYVIVGRQWLFERGDVFNQVDWFFNVMAVLLVLEFARRTTGWFIPTLAIVALTYVTIWGSWVGGSFHFPGLSWESMLFRSFIGGDGILGSIATISWTYVFMFILFGAFLLNSGAGEFIIDLARVVAGRFIGGPGLVAVVASGLMGSVSGSSVANTVSTGVITIPLMRRAGFPARFAAGVEAGASTGGQLMPPIMGAGAFIMASNTQLPYLTIIQYAALPALLYFLSVAFIVRIQARKSDVRQLEDEQAPALKDVMKRGWHFLLPIIVLVFALIYGFTPTYAAGVAILSVILASWLSPRPMKPRDVLDAMVLGSRNMVTTGILLLTVGLIVNVVSTTGIGNTFSLMVSQWAGGSLLLTLILVAIASLVLGMGLPVTASYIVLSTLSAPAIYGLIAESRLIELMMSGNLPQQAHSIFMLAAPDKMELLQSAMGESTARDLLAMVPPDFSSMLYEQAIQPETLTMILLSSHMIIFWLSQFANVTPPVCLTAFAAAAIARTPSMKTGFTSMNISKGLYIVPLLFAYSPLIGGTQVEMLMVFGFALFGIYAIIAAMEGYLEHRLNVIWRLVCLLMGLSMLWPHQMLSVDLAGLLCFVAFLVWSYRSNRPSASPTAATSG